MGFQSQKHLDVACLMHPLHQPLAPPVPIYSSSLASKAGVRAGGETELGELFRALLDPGLPVAPNAGLENQSKRSLRER